MSTKKRLLLFLFDSNWNRIGIMPIIVDHTIFTILAMLLQFNHWMILIIDVLVIRHVREFRFEERSSLQIILVDTGNAIKYGPNNSSRSSVTITAGSLTPNQTYQFVVYMINRRNSSLQATGYVIVKVEYTKPQLIAVG